jgi:hypothetical protein
MDTVQIGIDLGTGRSWYGDRDLANYEHRDSSKRKAKSLILNSEVER